MLTHPLALTVCKELSAMYLQNKYTTWYNSIISRAKNRQLTGYKENHHIIPKSLGGTNNKDNLVFLTAREHFICHLLLSKMVIGTAKTKMALALFMLTRKSKNQHRYKITNRQYEVIKNNMSVAKRGTVSPNRGKKITDSVKLDKIRAAAISREEKYKSGELSRGNMGKYVRTDAHLEVLRNRAKTTPGFSTSEQSPDARARAAVNISKARKGQPANNKGVPPVRLCCLHCRAEVDVRNFSRWHNH